MIFFSSILVNTILSHLIRFSSHAANRQTKPKNVLKLEKLLVLLSKGNFTNFSTFFGSVLVNFEYLNDIPVLF